jgi:pimeloyl-ACP methyl ester carboxylesterase
MKKSSLMRLLTAFIGVFMALGIVHAQEELPDPPGELIEVGGHAMHLYCIGEGSPTVILDGGAGAFALVWWAVQQQVAEFTRVCSYDRAGYGWSEPGTEPRTIEQVNTELALLLENADESAPYILVGHSLTGLSIPVFASQHLEDVAGVILVDPSLIEDLPGALDADVQAAFQELTPFAAEMQADPETPERLKTLVLDIATDLGLPEELIPAVVQFVLENMGNRVSQNEITHFVENRQQTAEALPLLTGVPFTIISAAKPEELVSQLGLTEVPEQYAEPYRVVMDYMASQQAVSIQAHADMAALANGQQVIAEDSAHNVMFDQPEIIVDVIRDMIEGNR